MSVSLLLLKVLNMFLDGEKGIEDRIRGEGRRGEVREGEGREKRERMWIVPVDMFINILPIGPFLLK